MKHYLLIPILCFFMFQVMSSQDLNETNTFSIALETKINFEEKNNLTQHTFNFKTFNSNLITIPLFPEGMNSILFSHITSYENNSKNYKAYLRGCGPLKDGITNPINSGDLMLSLTIDNFINNILFPKGIFFKTK